jgi:hypothetical protein
VGGGWTRLAAAQPGVGLQGQFVAVKFSSVGLFNSVIDIISIIMYFREDIDHRNGPYI